MIKALSVLIWIALAMGVGEVGYHALMTMAGKAAYAHQHDQISFSKWNRILWGAQPDHHLNHVRTK